MLLPLHPDTFSTWTIPQRALFAWCLIESLFWGWSGIQSLRRRQVWARVVPSVAERKKLREDWIRAIGSAGETAKEFVEGWFKIGKQKARLTEIHLENIKDWSKWISYLTLISRLCWAFFASTSEEVEADSALRAEMQETLQRLCIKLQEQLPDWKIPEGRNPNVDCIRLTLDPIKSEHRPIIFYMV